MQLEVVPTALSRLLLTALLAFPAVSTAARPSVRIAKRLDLGRLEASGLFSVERPALMDRGRAVHVAGGRGGRAYLVWLADHTEYEIRAPLRYARQRAAQSRLAFYDTPHQRAGMLLTVGNRQSRHHLFAHWDLDRRRITNVVRVGRSNGRATTELRPLGYSPADRRFYCQETRFERGARQQWQATIFSIDERADPRWVARIRTARSIHGVHYDASGERALVVEYAEEPVRGPAPVGHLVDLRSGRTQRITLPPTTYGIAFTPDGRHLHAYSSQGGKLWTIDIASDDIVSRRSVGGLGHALGQLAPGSLLLIRNSGLQVIDDNTGARRAFVPMRRVAPGFAHTEGSVVAMGQAIVKNGDRLHFVRLGDNPAPR